VAYEQAAAHMPPSLHSLLFFFSSLAYALSHFLSLSLYSLLPLCHFFSILSCLYVTFSLFSLASMSLSLYSLLPQCHFLSILSSLFTSLASYAFFASGHRVSLPLKFVANSEKGQTGEERMETPVCHSLP
jgi:hypothetical protein